MISRRHFLKTSSLGFISSILLSCSNEISKRKTPNILFIMLDDLGKEWVSCYGGDDVGMPNVEKLAKTGMLFHNAYCMPQCTPTRVTLLTGQYPFRHGWINHWDVPRWGGGCHFDASRNPSLAKILKAEGYETVAAGKWQINDFRVQPDAMEQHGFDDYLMWTGYETGNHPSAERYWSPYLHSKTGSKTVQGIFSEDIFADFIIHFMNVNKDKPMFIYYPMCLTHGPLIHTPLEPNVQEKIEKFKAMVRYTDFILGKLVAALDSLGIRENTIIIWTTDNGSSGGITGNINGRTVKGGKSQTTENGICVPFIVNCPGLVPTGTETDVLTDFTDILPTFAQLTGATKDYRFKYDGISIADVIMGKSSDSKREWILAMGGKNRAKLTENGVENEYNFRDRVIRDKRFKLYINTNRQPEKLVDLKSDPTEEINLLNNKNPVASNALKKFLVVLEEMPEKDSDPIYDPLPPQEWDVNITAKSQIWKK
jgi:arylsulfatase A-like enzyme